jgi:hypothetical protein
MRESIENDIERGLSVILLILYFCEEENGMMEERVW